MNKENMVETLENSNPEELRRETAPTVEPEPEEAKKEADPAVEPEPEEAKEEADSVADSNPKEDKKEVAPMVDSKMEEIVKEAAPAVDSKPEEVKKESASATDFSLEEMQTELQRELQLNRYKAILKSTVFTLFLALAIITTISNTILPAMEIHGTSMAPTINQNDVVYSTRNSECERGDIIVFYNKNKYLIKRVIGMPGEWINIDQDGNVFVDGTLLDEPYLTGRALGDTDITYPFQVPAARYFVLGDERSTSVDSRNTNVGCVSEEQIVGKVFFRTRPWKNFGFVK